MRRILAELHGRDPVLAWTGWLQLALLAVMLVIAPFDSRTVTGVNPWIKPIKFAASIGIYLWTVAWLLGYLSRPRWAIYTIRWGIALTFVVEIFCIVIQAARGTTSHWNSATTFDGVLWSAMSIGIQINALLEILLLSLFFLRPPQIPKVYLWSIRLGIIVFLVLGSAPGFVMVFSGGHTVGAPDGGPGLPAVNWSTRAGDLRIAHILGLHGLQILPLVGYGLTRWKGIGARGRFALLSGFAVAYVAIALLSFIQAMRGAPLIGLN